VRTGLHLSSASSFQAQISHSLPTENPEGPQTIERAGIQTLIIADTPRTKVNSIDCLARTNDPAQCSFPKYYNYHSEYDFLYSASSADDNISYVDFRDQICPSDDCQPVLGNILIFRDTHHLTVEYAESLSPFLENDFLRLAGR
jgi:hypothetical protein